ncbi:hypothetical protein UAY_00427 [Enterococcus moraviensis ATCC BAA-383]|uniref:DUF4097 domain-containing protein n=1 Tax=Enterococcus moraviensis ATCC BAA-383 TaxID=1158609 RepID=R2RFF8_9ENTE|nr:DUF4097 family beta strand repeat-containing protein [Enterococcus moraviensis]EOI06376.1 hypothetical protein UAY_00427 [Enterococcus moraviensis ATCC BAA-383]EOT63736.1 hypothetical protein I586_03169 [Enterococcus moraviensis ATCC BAA-383]OJG67134.1 hypothetical protein RV09_GL003043 [Enterococcus moraviensis]
MKKTTAFFLSIGVLAMIIGGIGSAVYFKRAEHSMTEMKTQTYEIKNKQSSKEIHLDLSGDAEFYILTENSNTVTMDTRSSVPVSLNSSLDVKEQKDQLTISANSTKKKSEFDGFKFGIFDGGSAVTLTIPENTERLVIDGKATGAINVSLATTKNLAITMNNADVTVSDINTEKLAIETTNGNLNVHTDVRADDATFKTQNGEIQLNDFAASKWSASSTSGDISLNSVKGMSTIETTNGEIHATDLKGNAKVKSINGDFSLYGTELPKELLVETQQGSIDLFTEEVLYDVTIKTKTKLGDSTIFGKERTSYKQGKATRTFTLQTNSGDISVEGPSDYEDGEDS